MKILHIDTRDREIIKVALEKNGDRFEESSRAGARSQITLYLIDKLLTKHRVLLPDIDHIKVERGPGSFTGLKVGVGIANALSFCLQKRVNNKKIGKIEIPNY